MDTKECEKILADGVFEHHFHKTSDNKDAEYKEYFETERFKEDFKNGKFNLGLGVEIDGFGFNLDFGSDDAEIHKFVEKVKHSVEFKMSSQFYQVYQYSVANVDLAKEYSKCLDKHNIGFKIKYETTETSITFKVSYANFDDLADPIFNDVFITPQSNLTAQTITKGEKIDNNSEEIFTFDLAKNTKEVIFTIDTDLTAQSLKVNLGKKGMGNGNLPIGTIITSFLTWEEFQKTTENNKDSGGNWKSEFSYWSPCDGREVPKSEYQSITSQTRVPELRGLFLRGLNTFDSFGEFEGKIPKVIKEHADTENRTRGSFQIDDFKSHSHTYDRPGVDESNAGTSNDPVKKKFHQVDTLLKGGDETRPKNAAIYYYIRIN